MSEYLHGFTKVEQDRLYSQARILENVLYSNFDLSDRKNLLEVGCGVGAQSEILLERYPNLNITAIDQSEVQLSRARSHFENHVNGGRIQFKNQWGDSSGDSAFFCWVLEHVVDPLKLLQQTMNHLKPYSKIVCIEVMNASFYLYPKKTVIMNFFDKFNSLQRSIGGHPDVGARLGFFLNEAGFESVKTKVITHHLDITSRKRRDEILNYWEELMLSAAAGLLHQKQTDLMQIELLKHEFQELREERESVFYYSCVVAEALTP